MRRFNAALAVDEERDVFDRCPVATATESLLVQAQFIGSSGSGAA